MRSQKSIFSGLSCPVCKALLTEAAQANQLQCGNCQSEFPIVDNVPVVIDENDSFSIFSLSDFTEKKSLFFNLSKSGKIKSTVAGLVPTMGGNNVGRKNFSLLADTIKNGRPGMPRVLMLGASIKGTGTDRFLSDPGLDIVESDVSFGPRTQIVLDAHCIPYEDGSFDAVVAQAVLEHVVDPQQCVSEMFRVLKPGGIVYTEIPFMQQVHGAAYDFMRFTHSGHRSLMRNFTEVKSGATAGAGTVMAWSYEYLLMSIFGLGGKLQGPVKLFARITGSWLRLLDGLATNERMHLDSCSGSFFIGKKSGETMAYKSLRDYYADR